MQVRRVQEMGGATLLVSLPKDWAKSVSLRKGSTVSIEQASDGGLLIYPFDEASESRPDKEIEIEYPSKYSNRSTPNEITAAYLLGYDQIRVKGRHRISINDRSEILSSIKLLIGLEVVEENAFSITTQFLVDKTAVEPSKIFRRISSIVRAMISDTIKQLTSTESYPFESIAQRDDEVDRLHFLLVRLIRTAIREPRTAGKYGLSAIDCLDFRVAASSLETAGDYAVELSNSVPSLKGAERALKSRIVQMETLLDSIQVNATLCFSRKDFELAQKVFEECEMLNQVLRGFRESPENVLPGVLHFADTVERIARCQRDIADLVSPMSPA